MNINPEVDFTNNSDLILRAEQAAVEKALEAIGIQAETNAKQNITEVGRVDTGRLRNSISHTADKDSAYIGTNVEYAAYNEFGTGIYAENGKGRQDGWKYHDDEGKWHFTRGMKPAHFLKRSVSEHINEYKEITEKILKNG